MFDERTCYNCGNCSKIYPATIWEPAEVVCDVESEMDAEEIQAPVCPRWIPQWGSK